MGSAVFHVPGDDPSTAVKCMAVCSAMTSSHNRLLYLSLHRNSGFFAVDLEDVTAGWGFPVGSSTFTVVGYAAMRRTSTR